MYHVSHCIPPHLRLVSHFGCSPGPSTCFVRSRDICRMRMPRTRTTVGSTAPTVLPASLEMIHRSWGKTCFSCWMLHVPDMISQKHPKTYTQNLPNVNPMRKKKLKKNKNPLDVFLVGRVLLRKRKQQPLSPADQRWDHKLFTAKSNSS